TSLSGLKLYLKELKGKRIIMTIEETTTSHWLYVELHDLVERIVICDPYRNKLLSDGPKTDPIDARKLSQLLISGLVKEVYHTTDELYELRKYVSAYEDLIKMGVRLKNQRSAFLKQVGKNKKTKAEVINPASKFVLKSIEASIDNYEATKEDFIELFCKTCKEEKKLKLLKSIPGIGEILAVKILAMVIEPRRFKTAGKYYVYCGLALHEEHSGGKLYGKRKPRYNRTLKGVYKTAAVAAIGGNNAINEYYEVMLKKGLPEHIARHQIARYIAKISLGVMKGEKPYQPYLWREKKEGKEINKTESTKTSK
ncbi:MAG: transposase, partial [Eubacteriales bacterium]